MYVSEANISRSNTGCLAEGRAGVGGNSIGVAVNQASGKVYVANSTSGTISVLENVFPVPDSISFTSIDGSVPTSQSVALSAPGALQYSASASSYPSAWLSVAPVTGTLPTSLTVSANLAGVPPG